MKIRYLIASTALCVSAPVATFAQESSVPTDQPGTAPTADDGERAEKDADKAKKICKRITKMGTRFSEKVCMTEAQWAAERQATQDSIRDSRR